MSNIRFYIRNRIKKIIKLSKFRNHKLDKTIQKDYLWTDKYVTI